MLYFKNYISLYLEVCIEMLDEYFGKCVSTSHMLCIDETKFDKLCINLAICVYWIIIRCVLQPISNEMVDWEPSCEPER